MAIVLITCSTIHCDGDCDGQGWDDEGPLHFDSADAAASYVCELGWTITAGRALCPECLRAADCAATGHQLSAWEDGELDGVPYRRRWCEHCGEPDHDPPMPALGVLLDLARLINVAADHLNEP